MPWFSHSSFESHSSSSSEGQEEAKMTKEDVEESSREGEQGCWFGEGGCHELSEMESASCRDYC